MRVRVDFEDCGGKRFFHKSTKFKEYVQTVAVEVVLPHQDGSESDPHLSAKDE